jgi:hypothetical protein
MQITILQCLLQDADHNPSMSPARCGSQSFNVSCNPDLNSQKAIAAVTQLGESISPPGPFLYLRFEVS